MRELSKIKSQLEDPPKSMSEKRAKELLEALDELIDLVKAVDDPSTVREIVETRVKVTKKHYELARDQRIILDWIRVKLERDATPAEEVISA